MVPRIPRPLAALLIAALAVAGCGKGGQTTSPAAPITADAADEVALQVGADALLTGARMSAALGSLPAGGARPLTVEPTVYDTTLYQGGITLQVSRSFYDADGYRLDGWSPLAVSLVWLTRAWGTLEGPRDTLTLGHSGSMELRGIQAADDTVTFQGYAYDTLTNHFRSMDGSVTRWGHVVARLTYSGVRFLKARAVNPWPLSGTATWTVSADRLRSGNLGDVESHWDATVTVVFNGTRYPAVTVDGQYAYVLNLETGQVARSGW